MTNGIWEFDILDDDGTLEGALNVVVRNEVTGALATLYEDESGNTGKNNPFNTADGKIDFYADQESRYKIVITDAQSNERTFRFQSVHAKLGSSAVLDINDISAYTSAGIYDDTTDGLAGTISGEYFWVVNDEEFELYLNDAGNAVIQNSIPFAENIVKWDQVDTISGLTSAGVYASIASGLAATSDGEYFWVVDGTYNLYLNDGGSEVEEYSFYRMNQDVRTTDAVAFATVNTGQGDNELYAMDQDVQTTDDVEFNSVQASEYIFPEGSATPSFTFQTVGDLSVAYGGTRVINYVDRGNSVFCEVDMIFTPTFTTSSGNALLTGWPFTPTNSLATSNSAHYLQRHARLPWFRQLP